VQRPRPDVPHEGNARRLSASGKSFLELKVRAYNRTPFVQTFLWWANVATRVHEAYQSFFPPDVYYVADHARRSMSEYPLAQKFYYGVNYGERGAKEFCKMKFHRNSFRRIATTQIQKLETQNCQITRRTICPFTRTFPCPLPICAWAAGRFLWRL